MAFSLDNTDAIQAHLNNGPYLSQGGLPGAADAQIFFALNQQVPDVNKHPNFHHWYHFMSSFSVPLMQKWIHQAPKKEQKKQAKKTQTKKVEDDDDDLFGDDDPAPVKKEVKKPEPAKKAKKVVIAKSIVTFDVKIYEKETNLDQLAKKIKSRVMDGLVWSQQYKTPQVAYGIHKLQLGCVIEDDKILTDDIFDPIEAWEEVQSVDMVSMQKL